MLKISKEKNSNEIEGIHNRSNGISAIAIGKIEGIPGDQEICPLKNWFPIMIEECKLIRQENGIPEGVNCRLSLENLFDTREEEVETKSEKEAETEESGIFSWLFNLIE